MKVNISVASFVLPLGPLFSLVFLFLAMSLARLREAPQLQAIMSFSRLRVLVLTNFLISKNADDFLKTESWS